MHVIAVRPVETRVVYSCAFFLLAYVLVVVSRPRAVFDAATGRPRPFGTASPDATLASLGVVTALLATLSYYMFCIVDVILA